MVQQQQSATVATQMSTPSVVGQVPASAGTSNYSWGTPQPPAQAGQMPHYSGSAQQSSFFVYS